MTPLIVALMIVALLTLVLVAMQIALRGPMPVARRRLFERIVMWGLCPALSALWFARAGFALFDGDMAWMLGGGSLGLMMIALALILFLKTPAADGTRT